MRKFLIILLIISFLVNPAYSGLLDEPSFFTEVKGKKSKCGILRVPPLAYCPCTPIETAFKPQLEDTQKKRVAASTTRVTALDPMLVKQMKAMIKSGDVKGASAILTTYTLSQVPLNTAKSYSALFGNFDSRFTSDFPEYNGYTSMTKEDKRLNDRWKQIEEGHMYALNAANLRFNTESDDRGKIFKQLMSDDNKLLEPKDGQTNSVQISSSMANQMSVLLDRKNQQIGNLVEVRTLTAQTKRAKKNAIRKNITAIAHNASTKQGSGQTFTLGM